MPFLRAARGTTCSLGTAFVGVRLGPGDGWPGAASMHHELNFPWRGGMLNFEGGVITVTNGSYEEERYLARVQQRSQTKVGLS